MIHLHYLVTVSVLAQAMVFIIATCRTHARLRNLDVLLEVFIEKRNEFSFFREIANILMQI